VETLASGRIFVRATRRSGCTRWCEQCVLRAERVPLGAARVVDGTTRHRTRHGCEFTLVANDAMRSRSTIWSRSSHIPACAVMSAESCF